MGANPIRFILRLQRGDGHVRYSRTSDQTPVWVTAQALTAIKRQAFPLAVVPLKKTKKSHRLAAVAGGSTISLGDEDEPKSAKDDDTDADADAAGAAEAAAPDAGRARPAGRGEAAGESESDERRGRGRGRRRTADVERRPSGDPGPGGRGAPGALWLRRRHA